MVSSLEDRETALHRATRLQNLDLVKLLLEYKADRKIKDKHGLRPVDVVKKLYRKLSEIIRHSQSLGGLNHCITSFL